MFLPIDIKTIYEHLGNEKSKQIYVNRFIYSITGDKKYIKNIIELTSEGQELKKKISNGKRKLIFSAGFWGKEIAETYSDIGIECFVDNKVVNEKEEYYIGKPVVSFQCYLKEYAKDSIIIIASRLYYNEIYNQLIANGVDDNLIINAGKMINEMSHRQYFDLDELDHYRKNKECFVDAGSFDGETSEYFADWCMKNSNLQETKIYAFEPDVENAKKCNDNIQRISMTFPKKMSYEVITKGLWDREEKLRFNIEANGISSISDTGMNAINVDKLDNMISLNEEVTFIKMDLEGSELRALMGAERIIRQYKPKLAISLYHKPEDIWELPLYILSLNSEYKFFIDHYSVATAETVLYAL